VCVCVCVCVYGHNTMTADVFVTLLSNTVVNSA